MNSKLPVDVLGRVSTLSTTHCVAFLIVFPLAISNFCDVPLVHCGVGYSIVKAFMQLNSSEMGMMLTMFK